MIELHPSGTETESGVTDAFDLGPTDRLLRLTLAVSSLVGSIAIVIESAPASDGPWRPCGDPTSDIASATVAYDRWVRLRWIGEDGEDPFSATFVVQAATERSYANFGDLYTHGRPAAGLEGVSTTERANALGAASMKADGKLRLRYDLPLVVWDDAREPVAKIAAYDLLSHVGFNPDGNDKNIRDRHNDAWKWLGDVADGTIDPAGIVDSTPEIDGPLSVMVTHASRGWR